MTHPKRADAFREWSKLMLEQAIVPDRIQYKSTSTSGKRAGKGVKGTSRPRRRRIRRMRKRKED